MIAIGSDHGGFALKEEIKKHLDENKIPYEDFGTYNTDSVDYPLIAEKTCAAITSGKCDKGILCCGTGIGISMAANKIKGIRCVTCSDPLSAELGRRHNNANMLSMGARIIGPELAKCIARAFLTAQFEGGRHALRVEMLSALERGEEIE